MPKKAKNTNKDNQKTESYPLKTIPKEELQKTVAATLLG
jgi:hypothetical protein